MTKNDFLNKLESALSGLPHEEIKKTLDYYSEIIDDAVEDGRNETEVIAGLGSIEGIAGKIIDETPIRKFLKEDVRDSHIGVSVIVLLIVTSPVWFPILTAAFAIAFSLYITLWAIVASFFAVFAVLALCGVCMLVASPFLIAVRPLKSMAAFGLAFVCAGLSVFIFYLSLWCAKVTIKFTLFIIRGIKNVFIKRRNDAK